MSAQHAMLGAHCTVDRAQPANAQNPLSTPAHRAAGSAVDDRSARAHNALPEDLAVKALFHVTSDVAAGALPRLLEPFAKMGVTPSRVHASCEAGDGSVLSVDLRVAETTAMHAHLIEKMLRRVVGVQQLILVTEAA